jgi:hypothetical protein
LSSSTGLFLEGFFVCLFFSMAVCFLPTLLSSRPPPLARMGWQQCKGLCES